MTRAVIAVHGGAGSFEGLKWRQEAPFREHMVTACELAGDHAYNAVDMVVAAVAHMETSGAYNAGKGSVLNQEGAHFLDGAVARGWDRELGAVAHVSQTYAAVHLAKAVMETSSHSLVAEGANTLARELGLPELEPPHADLRKVYEDLLSGKKQKEKLGTYSFGGESDTVGAVAMDRHGRLAAACSTGGTCSKRWGVSAIRQWWDPVFMPTTDAVCATGVGEMLMRGLASVRATSPPRRAKPSKSNRKSK